MIHENEHPLSGQTVKVNLQRKAGPAIEPGEHEFIIEDWWDRLTGGTWKHPKHPNWASTHYQATAPLAGLPLDNEVVYGHIERLGYLVHVGEIVP